MTTVIPRVAALAWAVGYTLLRLYWALGGRAGYPGPGGVPYGLDVPGDAPPAAPGAYDWVGVAVGLVLVVVGVAAVRGTGRLRPAVLGACCVAAAATLYFALPMLVMDLLRLTPLVPVGLDGDRFAARLVFGAGAACWIVAAVGYRRVTAPPRPARFRRWPGWLAAALPLPYVSLKLAWSLGSRVGWLDGGDLSTVGGGGAGDLVAGWGTVLLGLVGVPLGLALVTGWGRRLPRWTLLAAGWAGTAVLLPFAYVAPAALLAVLRNEPAQVLANWVFLLVYGSFAAWGASLAAATLQYSRRTSRAARPGGYGAPACGMARSARPSRRVR
jgi:hypothetical protein